MERHANWCQLLPASWADCLSLRAQSPAAAGFVVFAVSRFARGRIAREERVLKTHDKVPPPNQSNRHGFG